MGFLDEYRPWYRPWYRPRIRKGNCSRTALIPAFSFPIKRGPSWSLSKWGECRILHPRIGWSACWRWTSSLSAVISASFGTYLRMVPLTHNIWQEEDTTTLPHINIVISDSLEHGTYRNYKNSKHLEFLFYILYLRCIFILSIYVIFIYVKFIEASNHFDVLWLYCYIIKIFLNLLIICDIRVLFKIIVKWLKRSN